jgi:hypothetical protein
VRAGLKFARGGDLAPHRAIVARNPAAEDRRAGHEGVGAGAAIARMLSALTPPSTSSRMSRPEASMRGAPARSSAARRE